uniref:Uncharacterized protein n=1 Tax=viral metagenome TaxID=1070528 RepID=A0A6C0M221_9ZZZZ
MTVPLLVITPVALFSILPLIVKVPPLFMIMFPKLEIIPFSVRVAPFKMVSVTPAATVSDCAIVIVALDDKFQLFVSPCWVAMDPSVIAVATVV